MSQSILSALKIAFCYMPEDNEITFDSFGENVQQVLAEKKLVKEALESQGVNTNDLYLQLNPKL